MRKKGFPGYRANRQIGFEVTADASKPEETKVTTNEVIHHTLTSADESATFVLTSESFAFQTFDYGTFEHFSNVFARGLTEFQAVVGPELVSSMGVRFLDLVAPPPDELITAFLRPAYLGLYEILGEGWVGNYQFVESSLMRDGQSVKSRVLVRNSSVQLPPDLAGTIKALPPRVAAVNSTHAILDTDATYAPAPGTTMAFELEAIIGRMAALKADASDVFKATVTPEALKAWE